MGEPRTWDGQPIATDDPRGSSILVRRPSPNGGVETLLLHRAHHGTEFAGDWAWTCPAGGRHPGEPVYSGALRELREEAGISGFPLAPLDLSGRWARFVVDVRSDIEVRLVDPEHDRFEWVTAEESRRRVRPPVVAAGFDRVESAKAGSVTFDPLGEQDFADVLRWQRARHAAEWFSAPPADLDEAARRYGPRVSGDDPTRMWVARADGVRIGYMQAYPVAAYDDYAVKTGDPDAIGFDFLIGEEAYAHRGWGRVMVWSFMRDIICREYPSAPRFLASPDHRNARSLATLARCGLTAGVWVDVPTGRGDESDTEVVCTLDRVRWFGL